MIIPLLSGCLNANRRVFLFPVILFLLLLPVFAGSSAALARQASPAAHGGAEASAPRQSAKTALVLAVFGTTVTQAGDPLALVKAEIAARHPDLPIFVAYTSNHVIKTLRARQGKTAPGAGADLKTPRALPEVLATLSAQGYSHIVVQSLHVTPGKEFEDIRDIASRFNALPKGLDSVNVGLPLVGNDQDARALAAALIASLPAARKPDEAVIYVGHGAEAHAGTLAYPALQACLWERDPLLFVGLIEGDPEAPALLARLRAKGVTKIWLTPLLSISGEHAANDIFGDAESWKHIFSAAGIKVEPMDKGLLQIPAVVSLWADHVDAALRGLAGQRSE